MFAGLKRDREARRAMRYPTRFAATIVLDGKTLAVTVRDISSIGVMIEGAELPGVGRSMVFKAIEVSVEARTMWSRDGACGLEFRQEVNPLEIVRNNLPQFAQSRGQRPPRS